MNILLFGLFAVVLAGAQFRIDGQLIQSPTDIVAAIPDPSSWCWPAWRC